MLLQQSVEKQWYGKPHWLWLLAPLSLVFWGLSRVRKPLQTLGAKPLTCPVIVVGNIAVGGTGKTPLIIALANTLINAGFSPAIVSRGYGVEIKTPTLVPPNGDTLIFGDEPVLVANSCACPVIISQNRTAAVIAAQQTYGCDVVLSDDGLQHYRMARSFEIAVFDGARGIGNGWCLPVGPLRELSSRLDSVDFVVINGEGELPHTSKKPVVHFSLQPMGWVNVKTGRSKALSPLPWLAETGNNKHRILAVAGIGNPQRFFNTLTELGAFFNPKPHADHHIFTEYDFELANGGPVVMTAKDAVKCRDLAESNWWYLAVEASLPLALAQAVIDHCKQWPKVG
ncbi:MAG: tetraacyldisaccharide 4'-kinase [Marinagarivorans sp.]|nr:tetraacyldisaccharide 4'-kinase [Marinagarivorans sp.]